MWDSLEGEGIAGGPSRRQDWSQTGPPTFLSQSLWKVQDKMKWRLVGSEWSGNSEGQPKAFKVFSLQTPSQWWCVCGRGPGALDTENASSACPSSVDGTRKQAGHTPRNVLALGVAATACACTYRLSAGLCLLSHQWRVSTG